MYRAHKMYIDVNTENKPNKQSPQTHDIESDNVVQGIKGRNNIEIH